MFTIFESGVFDFRVKFMVDKKNEGNVVFSSVITSKMSVYAVPIGKSPGWLIVVSLMVI